MSGFVAIIATQPDRSVSEAEIDGFEKAYVALRGGVREAANSGDRVRAVAFVDGDALGPAIHRRGDSWALSAGTLHCPRSPLDAGLDEVEGQFALLRHDSGTNTSTVASDPFGMFGLFVAERDGLAYVATSALALARHLRLVPSRLGLYTFLLAGYQCGTRTGWEGVERVAGGTQIEFSADPPRRTTYWRPIVDHAVQHLGISASVDHCLEPAVGAVRMAGAGYDTVWCDLTGGYDTRILALLARAGGLSFITSTNGAGDKEDVRLARRIAAFAGWEWFLLQLPDDWERTVPERIPEAVGWGDGALDAMQLAGVLWLHEWKAKRTRGLLGGGGGEHYWSYGWQHEYGRAGRSGPTNLDMWIQIRMLRAIPTRVLARDPRPEVVADLRERMEPVIEPYLDEPRAVQADALYLHKSTGHFGAYGSAASSHIDGMLPFYTRASFTAAFSTNPRHRLGHRFYRRLMERLDPSIAALPTAKGGPARPLRVNNLAAFAPYYARLGEKGLNKAAQRLVGRSFRRPPELHDNHAAAARAAVVAAVGSDIATWHSRPLYDPDQLAAMLAAAARPDFRDSTLLGRVLTTELSLRAAGARVE